jgi:hypothetical protein
LQSHERILLLRKAFSIAYIISSSPLYSIVKNFNQEKSNTYLLYTLRVTPLSTCKIASENEQLSESQISESQLEQLPNSSLYKGSVSLTVNQLLALKETGVSVWELFSNSAIASV